MTPTLPTLVLSAQGLDGFFFIDGQPAARSDGAVRVPAPTGGMYCLQLFPLQPGEPPVTIAIDISEGSPRIHPKNAAQVVRWPDNVWEIRVLPPVHVPHSPFPRMLDGCPLAWNGGMYATLFWEDALYVAIEDEEGNLVLGEHLSDTCTGGRLEAVAREDAAEVLVIRGEDSPGLLALVRCDEKGKPELYFCERADSISLETGDGPVLNCVRDMDAPGGHQLQTRIPLDRELRLQREIGFFTRKPAAPASGHDLVRMFLDAVLFGLEKEAARCLTPALRDNYPIAVLQEYLGDFNGYSVPPYALQADDERPVFGLYDLDAGETASRVFEFEVVRGTEADDDENLYINNIKEKYLPFE